MVAFPGLTGLSVLKAISGGGCAELAGLRGSGSSSGSESESGSSLRQFLRWPGRQSVQNWPDLWQLHFLQRRCHYTSSIGASCTGLVIFCREIDFRRLLLHTDHC